ncbi:LOG family protein [Aquimarina macrocephali]|uniref:LOG family protein n=1 Tax=Aquimarina macrocephali TaxID=666563 RepID=UPI0004B23EEF|nr:LOG family protein [Aquimarina macrocephali]
MKTIKYATLFGGAGKNQESIEYKETILIGSLLTKNGYIIKNGGYGGMMEAVSKGASIEGGKAIGITCKQVGSEKGNKFLSETVVTKKLYERLELLIQETSIFIVQKGGIGTLSEVFLTLDIIRKDKSVHRPKVFFIGDFWNNIIEVLKSTIIPEYEHHLFKVVKDFEEFNELISQEE